MKKRNLFLLPLLVLGSTGLTSLMTSCKDDPIVEPGPGLEEPGPEEPGPEEPVVVAPTSIAFAEDSLELKVGNQVYLPAVTVLPENATDKSFTVTNSNEAVVKLVKDGDKYGLEAVAPGDAVITVASVAKPELTDTLNVHVPEIALPTPVSATIAELNAKTATDTTNLYEVTGVISSIKHDEFGNMYLATEDGLESIMVYGATGDSSSIAYDASYKNLVFTNPRDFISSGLTNEIDLGDVITMVVQFKMFGTTPEIMGYVKLDSIVKSSTRPNYSIKLTNDDASGTASFVAKNEEDVYAPIEDLDLSALCWGQKLTLQAIPTASSEVAIVKANGKNVEANEDGTFTIVVVPGLQVEVSYEDPAAIAGFYDMDTTSFGIKGSYNNYTGKCSNISLAALNCGNYGAGIQMKMDTTYGTSAVYNTSETTGNIVSIKVTFTESKYTTAATKDLLNVVASTSAFSLSENKLTLVVPEGASSQIVKFNGTEYTYEFTFEASAGYKYFALNHTSTKGTEYIASIVVTTDAYTPSAAE